MITRAQFSGATEGPGRPPIQLTGNTGVSVISTSPGDGKEGGPEHHSVVRPLLPTTVRKRVPSKEAGQGSRNNPE